MRELAVRRDIININWTAAPLSGPQKFIIRQLATLFLKTRGERDWIDFTHELVEGRIHIKSRGSFGTYAGTFFHVDLGEVNGVKWTMDFLLPVGMENHEFRDGDMLVGLHRLPDGRTALSTVDPMKWRASEASLLG